MTTKADILAPVLDTLKAFYPLNLADSSWDNVGLLVDCTNETTTPHTPRVLVCVDLTQAVAEEAIQNNVDLVFAYHPFIFRGIKAIDNENPQHRSLKSLIKHDISVYSPHTAVDAAKGGVNDWLADIVSHTKSEVIQPAKSDSSAGYGRLVTLSAPLTVAEFVEKCHNYLKTSDIMVIDNDKPIKSIALCAGSGGSVLSGCNADLWFTGELSHHEMLYLKESGISAAICGHWATERGFLTSMIDRLNQEVKVELVLSKADCQPYKPSYKPN